jgi:4-hydroxybenzoate polyprenyltransferase
MFLNDAFDVEFDRQHRKERPIPSGAIPLRSVWQYGFAILVAGAGLLFVAGLLPGLLGLMLALCVVLYDAVHKFVPFSPVLMGACRLFVYLIAAAVAKSGVTGWAIWCGLALAIYVVGLSYVARRESTHAPLQYWSLPLLAAPIVLALLTNTGKFREPALLLSLVLVLWSLRALRTFLWTNVVNVGRTVSGLLAGIVFVDWLAVCDLPREMSFVFLALFGCAVLFQRFVPAT